MADLTTVTQKFNAAKDSAAAYTEGVSALPGGMNAIASVVNNAPGALNSIPGVGAVAGAVGALGGAAGSIAGAVGALGGAAGSIAGAVGALGGAAGALATKGLDALKSGGATLSALATTGLPAGAAAQMNSAIAALSSGGSVPIKLPTVATGTYGETAKEMTAKMTSLFGSTKIPGLPTGGNPATFGTSMSAESIKKFDENKAAIAKAQDDYWAQQDVQTLAWQAWDDAKNNLPQGDPQIESLKSVWLAEGAKKEAIQKKIDDLRRA